MVPVAEYRILWIWLNFTFMSANFSASESDICVFTGVPWKLKLSHIYDPVIYLFAMVLDAIFQLQLRA